MLSVFRYYKDFLDSTFYRKYQIDILTSGKLQLLDVLYNDNAMGYFMEVCDYSHYNSLSIRGYL